MAEDKYCPISDDCYCREDVCAWWTNGECVISWISCILYDIKLALERIQP